MIAAITCFYSLSTDDGVAMDNINNLLLTLSTPAIDWDVHLLPNRSGALPGEVRRLFGGHQ